MRHRGLHPQLLRNLSVLVAVGCGSSGSTQGPAPIEVPAPVSPEQLANDIGPEDVLTHVAYLASDDLLGRDTPSPGLEMAARYLADAFASYGLEPAGDDGSYLQRYPYEERQLEWDRVAVVATGGDEERSLRYRDDFFLIPSAEGEAEGEVVFVGSLGSVLEGLPDGVAGKMAVVTAPAHVSSELFPAIRAAGRANVAGLVIVLAPETPDAVVGLVADQIEGQGGMLAARPAIGLPYASTAALFRSAGRDLNALRASADEGVEAPVPVGGLALRLLAPARMNESEPANVVAVLPGRDPGLRDTYVLVTAHYDHEGVGTPDASGDSVYNGADDNASGTAVLLEVARALARLPVPPARSVLFLAVSGEEKGLVGSAYYAEQPTVPVSAIVGNINIDMVGRGAPDTIISIGQEYTSLGDRARGIAEDHPSLGLALAPDPDPEEMYFLRSDQVSFVRKNIPAIFFTTPDHEDYHRPSDEVEGIDAEKVARVARLTLLLTAAVAEDQLPPAWNAGSLEEVRALLADSPF